VEVREGGDQVVVGHGHGRGWDPVWGE
jgi:hypothetical protein